TRIDTDNLVSPAPRSIVFASILEYLRRSTDIGVHNAGEGILTMGRGGFVFYQTFGHAMQDTAHFTEIVARSIVRKTGIHFARYSPILAVYGEHIVQLTSFTLRLFAV